MLALLIPLSSVAQTLEITKPFKMNEFSTVLTTYKNEFGHRVKPGVKDNAFPYAVIEVHLKGDARAVTAAKEKLSLDMGALYMVEGVTKAYDNKIVFLVSSSVRTIYMTCGDGCEKQAIFEGVQLKPDRIYSGEVRYTPEDELVATTQAPKRQFFKLQVSPLDAFVEVSENGTKMPWRVVDGVAAKVLNYGIYSYTVSANRYHTEEGTFMVSDGQNSKLVTLKPKFGWLSVMGSAETMGAYAFATHKQTGTRVSLGVLPFSDKELDAGEYQVLIQQSKYKDYTTTVTIDGGKTSSLKVSLVPNFVQVTLTTQSGADILIDGTKLGTSSYSGTLELGDYTIETRLASHKSAYTQVSLSPASAGKTIALNNPVPIYGSLMIDGLPMLATLYVDGQNKGTAPLIIDELLIGSHKVRIEKDGYEEQETTIQITEGEEKVLKYELVKATKTIDQNRVIQLLKDICKNSSRGGNYTALVNYYTETIIPFAYADKHRKISEIASTTKKFVEGYPEYNISAPYNVQFVNTTFPLTVECDVDVTFTLQNGKRMQAYIHKTLCITSDYKVSGFLDKEYKKRKTLNESTSQVTPTQNSYHNNHEYVDLGLSVKWATCNIGARRPEDFGDHFAWGETKPKNIYDWSTYRWCCGKKRSITKYCTKKSYGKNRFVDNKTTLDLSDDAAYVNWGGSWRMPTDEELNELFDNCTWTVDQKGYKVTSKINGNSIFFPGPGIYAGNQLITVSDYWSKSLVSGDPNNALVMSVRYDNKYNIIKCVRSVGRFIRPVCP